MPKKKSCLFDIEIGFVLGAYAVYKELGSKL